MALKRIAVLTTGRQDYGILHSLCCDLQQAQDFELLLIVSGTHLAQSFGYTVEDIEADGLPICERIEATPASDSKVAAAQSAGHMTALIAQALNRQQPDLLMLVGDRYETLAASLASTLVKVPLAHLHGGEETEGAFDNSIRHAITKLSHLHYASNDLHARRIIQMGEDPERVLTVGAPGLDAIRRTSFLTRAELEEELQLSLTPPILVVTYHPTTLAESSSREEIEVVLGALMGFAGTIICTLPNADPENDVIRQAISDFVKLHPRARAFESLGSRRYLSLLKIAEGVLGNSSSGLIETPLFELPTVNVGERQSGRLRGINVIDAPLDLRAIAQALEHALAPAFRQSLQAMPSPYGDGRASERILKSLRQTQLGVALLRKQFHWSRDAEQLAVA